MTTKNRNNETNALQHNRRILHQYAMQGDLVGLRAAARQYPIPPNELSRLVGQCVGIARAKSSKTITKEMFTTVLETAFTNLHHTQAELEAQFDKPGTRGEVFKIKGLMDRTLKWIEVIGKVASMEVRVQHLRDLAERNAASANGSSAGSKTQPRHNATKHPATHQRRGRRPKSTNGTKPEKPTTAKNAKNAKTK